MFFSGATVIFENSKELFFGIPELFLYKNFTSNLPFQRTESQF